MSPISPSPAGASRPVVLFPSKCLLNLTALKEKKQTRSPPKILLSPCYIIHKAESRGSDHLNFHSLWLKLIFGVLEENKLLLMNAKTYKLKLRRRREKEMSCVMTNSGLFGHALCPTEWRNGTSILLRRAKSFGIKTPGMIPARGTILGNLTFWLSHNPILLSPSLMANGCKLLIDHTKAQRDELWK